MHFYFLNTKIQIRSRILQNSIKKWSRKKAKNNFFVVPILVPPPLKIQSFSENFSKKKLKNAQKRMEKIFLKRSYSFLALFLKIRFFKFFYIIPEIC